MNLQVPPELEAKLTRLAGEFVTSSLVLTERSALVAAHLGRPAALALWESLRESRRQSATEPAVG